MKNFFIVIVFAFFFASCNNQSSAGKPKEESKNVSQTTTTSVQPATIADAKTIMERKQVPVLCYHHIRDIQMVSKANKGYEVTAAEFRQQMKTLADSGYHTITPDQYYNYLITGAALPPKPFILSFDDTDEEQFSIGKPEMDKYGFKGLFFIMTISIGRPHYMTKEQIKQLSDEGNVIACHTWDHHRVDRYIAGDRFVLEGNRQKKVNDWNDQLDKPRKTLEDITGKKIEYFAYPYGIWSKAAFPEFQKRGYKLAFQLSEKRDSLQPLYTVRRMIVSPEWSATGVLKVMKNTFR